MALKALKCKFYRLQLQYFNLLTIISLCNSSQIEAAARSKTIQNLEEGRRIKTETEKVSG